MFDLDDYLRALILGCQSAFGDRLKYVGLQGSYLRGEVHENSDIDGLKGLQSLDAIINDTVVDQWSHSIVK